jgi:hypothetical protein
MPALVCLAGVANLGPQNNGGTIQRACRIKAGFKRLCYQSLNHLPHFITDAFQCYGILRPLKKSELPSDYYQQKFKGIKNGSAKI